MVKNQSIEDIYSALFVDFDNMYMRLHEQDQNLARTFAVNPQRWTRWIEGHALRMLYGDGVRRRILKKVCYINPHRYREFRPYFVRSAFQVVDCPSHPGSGRTAAEIHLTMDVLDTLAHPTRYDEVILVSGDADYTPLAMRISEHARRSLVLAMGYTSPAYLAACSWRIREDWFTAQALEEAKDDYDGDPRYSEESRRPQQAERPESRPEPRAERRPAAPAKHSGFALPANRRVRLVEAVKQLVAESTVPVPLPSVAQVLQQEQEAGADWFGAGTLRDLIEDLDISPLLFSPHDQGFVYDPDRHDLPEDSTMKEDFRKTDPEMFALALALNRHTDIPLLPPARYAKMFSLLADELSTKGFSHTDTTAALEDRCYDEGLPITGEQAAFVVESVTRGMQPISQKDGKNVTPAAVAKAFHNRTLEICRGAGLNLNDSERSLLPRWLSAE